MKTTITINDLWKRYGRVEALRGVTLSIAAGEIFGLLGPNGAGKTTLIRTLIGATKPSAGQVTVLDLDPLRAVWQVRRQIGYMPQLPALYPDLSPRDNIRFFGQGYGLADTEAQVTAVLALTDLIERQHDPVQTFSGGMRQRVSLACALVHRPAILLLDEPSAGVDPRLRQSFWDHFRRLAEAGATILVSTHQLDEALHCDRVAVMRRGEILACDTPRNLLQSGQTAVTIWRQDRAESHTLANYPQQLPLLLHDYGLDTAVQRIELDMETMEDVVLGLTADQPGEQPS
jgi:ABC-2 type transport system ATP-binding protein